MSKESKLFRDVLYTEVQVEIIRRELNKAYKMAVSEYGEGLFDRMALASEIEEKFEEKSEEEISCFPKAYHKIDSVDLRRSMNGSGGRTMSFERFMKGQTKKMNNIRMIACEIYLTDPNCEYSHLTKEELRGNKKSNFMQFNFSNFFHSTDKALKIEDYLLGEYFFKLNDEFYTLELRKSSQENLLSAKLILQFIGVADKKVTYQGWGIRTIGEPLILSLNNAIKNEKMMLVTVAVDKSIRENKEPRAFVMLPFGASQLGETQSSNNLEMVYGDNLLALHREALKFVKNDF